MVKNSTNILELNKNVTNIENTQIFMRKKTIFLAVFQNKAVFLQPVSPKVHIMCRNSSVGRAFHS